MKKLGFFGIGILVILVAIPAVYAESECDVSYVEPELGFGYQYQLIDPTDYSITGGEFLSLCVEPNYLWYEIYLDTDEPGSLTITIPKDKVDLKQFDYESCYPDDLGTFTIPDGKFYDYRTATVKQLSQTDTSRTLEFSWTKPIFEINYFRAYAIIDGVNYSEPNYCIGLVESGEKSAEIVPRSEKTYEINQEFYENHIPKDFCPVELELNFNISSGAVEKFCKFDDANSVIIYINNINSNSELLLDIPIVFLYPKGTMKYDEFFVIGNRYADLPNVEVVKMTETYQTFKIPLLPKTTEIEIIYALLPGGSNIGSCQDGKISITKNDNSKSACVKPTTAEKLFLYGWAFPSIHFN